MTRRHHRAGGCRLPLTALLLLRAGALLWAAAHAAAHAALLRGAAAAASPEAFPTASELRPVPPAAAPPLSTAPTADPAPKQFLVTRPPLELVDAVFHVKGKPGDRRWSDPRRGMADTEPEVGFGDEASAIKDRKEQRRLRLLERVTMHTKTRVEREAAARKSRVHEDKSQMRGRVSAWEKRHHPGGAGADGAGGAPSGETPNRRRVDGRGSASSEPRFVSTTTANTMTASHRAGAGAEARVGGGGSDGYVAPQEPENHEETVKIAENEALNEAVEQSVKDSETLANPEVIEHTGEEDPENKEEMGGGGGGGEKKNKEGGSGDEDGPEEGGAGEKSPINKYYKWWSLSSWSPAEVSARRVAAFLLAHGGLGLVWGFFVLFFLFASSVSDVFKNSVKTPQHYFPYPPAPHPQLQSMVNSPSHGQLNTDVGGKRSATNTHGDDVFAAEMADVTSGAAAAEGKGEGDDKEKDGSVRYPDIKPFPAWTRKSDWLRADANFAPEGIVPPTEADQKEIEDAIKTQMPEDKELDDALDPARTKELMGAANVGAGGTQDSLHNAMNSGAQ